MLHADPTLRTLRQTRARAGVWDWRWMMRWLMQRVMMFVGIALLIVAIPIALVTPVVPIGLPLAIIGLLILLNSSVTAKRWFVRWGRRHPVTMGRIRKVLRKKR